MGNTPLRRASSASVIVSGLLAGGLGSTARAETLLVPGDAPTLQAAVDAAAPGDEIRLGPGRHCGARVDKSLAIVGSRAAAAPDPAAASTPVSSIVGCADGPTHKGRLRVGLLLEGDAASGTRISGLTFDGRGSSDADLTPLALGVFARFVDDVVVSDNTFTGTVQPITNTAGDRWVITGNRIAGFAPLGCPGGCGGGVGIAVQPATGDVALLGGSLNPRNRAEDNTVADNLIETTVPEAHDAFGLAGIFVQAADRTVVSRNRVAIRRGRANESATGIALAAHAGADATGEVPGTRDTVVEDNDGHASDVAVLVEARGVDNTQGLLLRGNRGRVVGAAEGTPGR